MVRTIKFGQYLSSVSSLTAPDLLAGAQAGAGTSTPFVTGVLAGVTAAASGYPSEMAEAIRTVMDGVDSLPAKALLYADQDEALEGVDNLKWMTALRARQAIADQTQTLTPEMYGAVGDGVTDDTVALDLMNAASVDGSEMFFRGIYVHGGEFELKGRRSYRGASYYTSGLKLKDGANKSLAVSDRWLRSNTSLGRPLLISNMEFDANKAANTSGHALILCNFRPIVVNCRIANGAEDGLHMPATLKDGTVFNSNSVGAMMGFCRFEGNTNHHLYAAGGADAEQTTYTDGWFVNNSIGNGGLYAMWVEPASGWFVDNIHCSGISGPYSLYFYGASILNVHHIYLENWGTADLTLNRFGIRVAKVKAGAGVFISQVGGNITSTPNTNVIQCMVSVEGGASPGQFAHISHIHMDSLSGHNYNLGLNTNCSTGGTLTVDYDHITMTNFTRSVRIGTGGGTMTLRAGTNNSWNFGTAIPLATTNGSWPALTEIKNTDATNQIDRFLCTATGNPGTWLTLMRYAPLTGTTAPATTPSFIGQQYINTTAKMSYLAAGTTSSADWQLVPTAPLFGAGAPATTPSFTGQLYIDTTTKHVYYAAGTASSADWLEFTLSGAVAPVTTPAFVGQVYVDTVAKKAYIATATASSADWTILN